MAEEVQSYIIADNRGEKGDEAWFALNSCPECGGELFAGESNSIRLDAGDAAAHDMLGDIDSGNRVEADLSAKRCQVCDYSKVKVEVYGYAGY